MKITKQAAPTPPPAFVPFDVVIRVESQAEHLMLHRMTRLDVTIPTSVQAEGGDQRIAYAFLKHLDYAIGPVLR